MVQLDRFTFNRSGALHFDAQGNISEVGTRYLPNLNAVQAGMWDEDCDDDDCDPFSEIGPFGDTKSYFLATLDQREAKLERSDFFQGADNLLRYFIEWGLAEVVGSEREKETFVLAHPDLDTQNILTLEDGTLTGIIDWDWVAAIPSSVACHKFPEFLLADYDRDVYKFDVKAGKPLNGSGECSPLELIGYRAMYAQFMERLRDKNAADITRKSAIMGTLETAAHAPMATLGILRHLFDEIREISTGQKEELSDTASESSDGEEIDPTADMSFEELLQEIKELVKPLQAGQILLPNGQDTAINGKTVADDAVLGESNTDTEESTSGPRRVFPGQNLSRTACCWGARKLQNAAGYLHRPVSGTTVNKPQIDFLSAEGEPIGSRKAKFARNLHQWTQFKLRHAIELLHCEKDPDFLASEDDRPCNNGLQVMIEWVIKKLDRALRSLHSTETERENPVVEHTNPQNSATHVFTGEGVSLSDRVKLEACNLFADMLQENKDDMLTEFAQKAFARWIVKSIRPEKPTEKAPEEESTDQRIERECRERALKERSRISELEKNEVGEAEAKDSSKVDGSNHSNTQDDLSTKENFGLQDVSFFHTIFPNHNRGQESAPFTQTELSGLKEGSQNDEKNSETSSRSSSSGKTRSTKTSSSHITKTSKDSLQDTSFFDTIFPNHNKYQEAASPTLIDLICLKEESQKRTSDDEGSSSSSSSDKSGSSKISSRTTTTTVEDENENVNEATTDIDPEINRVEAADCDDRQDKSEPSAEKAHKKHIELEESDEGYFTMWDICHGLAKGEIDDRRMKRLKDGFLALLNQSL